METMDREGGEGWARMIRDGSMKGGIVYHGRSVTPVRALANWIERDSRGTFP